MWIQKEKGTNPGKREDSRDKYLETGYSLAKKTRKTPVRY
jgi:hypothetical protein